MAFEIKSRYEINTSSANLCYLKISKTCISLYNKEKKDFDAIDAKLHVR